MCTINEIGELCFEHKIFHGLLFVTALRLAMDISKL